MIGIREAEAQRVPRKIQYDEACLSLHRTQSAPDLLNVQSKGFRGTTEDHAGHAWHVHALRNQVAGRDDLDGSRFQSGQRL